MSLQITALLDALAASQGDKLVREGVTSWLGGAAAPKAKKVKAAAKKAASEDTSDEDKPKKPANAWIRYVEHVCGPKGLETEAYKAWVAEHPDVKGNKKIKFASELKQENPEDYAAFAAEHKSSSSASSVSAEEKPKSKAKPKKASKAAGAGILLSDSEDEAPKPKPKPKKAPAKKAVPPLPVSDDESDSGDALPRIKIFGQEFYHDTETDELYDVEDDGTRGKCVGTYDGTTAHFA